MSQPITRRGLALGAAALAALPRIARAADDTIKIGVMTPVTGPAAEAGKLQQNGIKIALDAVNEKGVLGRKFEIVTEDDQTTNPGAVLAFSRLASRPDIVAFIGPIRSTQVNAVAPDVLKTGKPMLFGGTDPTLTQQGNPWLFRCRPNDSYSAKVIAEFGVGELKKQKWAVVYSTDAFGTNGSKALEAALKDKGITPVLMQGYTNQASDYTAVVLAVRQSGADVLGSYFTFESDLGIFARQLRQLGVTIPWVGSPSIVNTTALNLAGRSLFGTYGVADYAVDATPASKAFGDKYQSLYKALPDNQSSYAYDAVMLLARAITDAGGTEPEKLRAALAAIKEFAGAEGEYNFDGKGDGLRGYNIVKNENGKVVFDRRIEVKG
ncbi:MAG: ABC transporter substrate-binding protein [Janthinobacterium lividum]